MDTGNNDYDNIMITILPLLYGTKNVPHLSVCMVCKQQSVPIGLGILSIFTQETQNICSVRVPDSRFFNAIQNSQITNPVCEIMM